MVGSQAMRSSSCHLRRLAGGWLVMQLAVFVSIPTALCLNMSTSATGVECTCAQSDGQMCPMHHTRSKANSPSCSCRSTADPAAAIIASLLGPSAVLTDAVEYVDVTATSETPGRSDWSPIDALIVPSAPPPRA